MKKIFKSLIFCTIFCIANYLIFFILLSISTLPFMSLDNKIHMNLLISIVFIIFVYLISKIYIKRKTFCIKNLKIEKVDIYAFILIGMLISMTFFILVYNIERKFNFIYFERYLKYFKEDIRMNNISIINQLEVIVTSVVLVPIGEELYFRKLGLNFLKHKGLDVKYAILFSSISFGLFHFRVISSLVSSFLIGIIAALTYVITGKLRYAVFTHGLNNLLAMSSSLYYQFILKDTPDIDFIIKNNENITGIIYIFTILLLLFLIKVFYKRKVGFYKEKIIEIYKEIF